jgi:hypothetical protein
MNLADIKNGIVVNIILVDPANIPDFCADWPEATEGCQIGGTYAKGVFTPLPEPPVTADEARAQRDAILRGVVDPFVSNPLRWADLSAAKKTAWAAYRTALLDVPQQSGFPNAVVWPTAPEA